MDDSEHEEFVGLLTRHQRQIWWFLNTLLPSSADADDVMQETSIVLWRKWGDFEKGSDFCRWACVVARLETLRYIRRGKTHGVPLSDKAIEIVAEITEKNWSELAKEDHRRNVLTECIEKLGEPEKEAIKARYFNGTAPKTLADDWGKPLQTVYSILTRARTQLADCVHRTMESIA